MLQGTLLCWCDSDLPQSECHAQYATQWCPPEALTVRLPWHATTDQTTQLNIANYVNNYTHYRAVVHPEYLELSCPASAPTFFYQSLVASSSVRDPTGFSLPLQFSPWQPAAVSVGLEADADLVPGAIRRIRDLPSIDNIDDFVTFKKFAWAIFEFTPQSDLASDTRLTASNFLRLSPDGAVDFFTVAREERMYDGLISALSKHEVLGIPNFQTALNQRWHHRTSAPPVVLRHPLQHIHPSYSWIQCRHLRQSSRFQLPDTITISKLHLQQPLCPRVTTRFHPSSR